MNFVPDIFSEKLYLMENVPFLYLNNKFSEKKQNFFCWRFYQPFGLSLKVWKNSKEGWRQVSRSVLHLSCYRKFSKISRRTPAPKSLFKKRSFFTLFIEDMRDGSAGSRPNISCICRTLSNIFDEVLHVMECFRKKCLTRYEMRLYLYLTKWIWLLNFYKLFWAYFSKSDDFFVWHYEIYLEVGFV